jgi:glycosyltransferase involved in cell wall biosynthesis
VLEESLTAVQQSTDCPIPKEIIVVDDGSTDETPRYLRDVHAAGTITEYIRNDIPRGPATARNQGIRKATGEYSLIMGDDVIFFPDAIASFRKHIEHNGLHNASVIGNIMPHPDGLTAFEYWSCHGGSQFGHNRIPMERRFDAGDAFFYTSNVISATELMRQNPFDESFPYPRYEDRELGYRLKHRLNHKIHYLPDARSYHKHRLPFRRWLMRFERFTWSALHFCRLYPHDRELRQTLGISTAKKTDCFNFKLIAISVDIINQLHQRYLDSEPSFGQTLMKQQVANAFRTVQEFFRLNYLRKHLGLALVSDATNQMEGNEAMARVLETLEKDV